MRGPEMVPGAYGVLLLAGVLVSAWVWTRAARRDARLPVIYLGALVGAFVGAKLVYFAAEGFRDLAHPDWLRRLATGKTILGGLLFGYLGVELAKRATGYREPTGDRFALIAPLGISFGRVGCLLQGCCPGQPCGEAWYSLRDAAGVPRWPAVPAELAFNLVALALFAVLYQRRWGRGQLFHLYLIAYGLFRFGHEFLRDTPRLLGPLSGYHAAAAALVILGTIRYIQRRAHSPLPPPT